MYTRRHPDQQDAGLVQVPCRCRRMTEQLDREQNHLITDVLIKLSGDIDPLEDHNNVTLPFPHDIMSSNTFPFESFPCLGTSCFTKYRVASCLLPEEPKTSTTFLQHQISWQVTWPADWTFQQLHLCHVTTDHTEQLTRSSIRTQTNQQNVRRTWSDQNLWAFMKNKR